MLDIAVTTCKRRIAYFRRREKGIVYCRSRDKIEELAKELGCGFVYAKATDNEQEITN